MRHSKTNTYTHLLSPQHKSFWCLVPGVCPSRSPPNPPFLWCDRGEHVSADACWRESCHRFLLHQTPGNARGEMSATVTGLGHSLHGHGQPSTKEWGALETLGLQAIPQLRGRFVHWNIRPESALWQSRAMSFFRLGEHSLQTCRRWDVSCEIFHGHQLDWVPQLPAWAAWSLSTGLQVMNSQRLK